MDWQLYMLDCDGRWYTGITTDLSRRVGQHRSRRGKAARFTRSATSHTLIYHAIIGSRGLALRAEARVKKLSRARKELIVREAMPRDRLLVFLGLDG